MALSSIIQFGDNNIRKYSREYRLSNLACHFVRENDRHHPTTDAVCESIAISLFFPEKEDRFLIEWYLNNESLSGRIITEISDPLKDNESLWKEILFEDASCFSMGEEYELDTIRRTLKLDINASRFIIDDVRF